MADDRCFDVYRVHHSILSRRTSKVTRRRSKPLTSKPASSAARVHRMVLSAGSIVKPSFQRRLAFCRWLAEDQVVCADVLIQPRPVNSAPTSDQPPVGPLFGSPVTKSRVPGQRSRNRSTVRKFHSKNVIGNRDCGQLNVLCVNR